MRDGSKLLLVIGVVGLIWAIAARSRDGAPTLARAEPADVPLASAAVEAAPAAPRTDTVQSGESWYGIADKVRVSPLRLMAVNAATPDTVIHPGQSIALPADEDNGVARTIAPAPTLLQKAPTIDTSVRPADFEVPLSEPVETDEPATPPEFGVLGFGGGTTLCEDGSFSGASGRGACSHHGGISGGSHHHGGGHHRGR